MTQGSSPEKEIAANRREYVSVQRGLWRSLWLVLRGARVREWELWPADEAESLTLDDEPVTPRSDFGI